MTPEEKIKWIESINPYDLWSFMGRYSIPPRRKRGTPRVGAPLEYMNMEQILKEFSEEQEREASELAEEEEEDAGSGIQEE